MTASVPEFEKRTSSAAGTMLAIRSATAHSRSVERAKTPPTSLPAGRAARIPAGRRVAEDAGAISQPVVDVFIAIDVRQAGALGRLHVDGLVLAPKAEIGGGAGA